MSLAKSPTAGDEDAAEVQILGWDWVEVVFLLCTSIKLARLGGDWVEVGAAAV